MARRDEQDTNAENVESFLDQVNGLSSPAFGLSSPSEVHDTIDVCRSRPTDTGHLNQADIQPAFADSQVDTHISGLCPHPRATKGYGKVQGRSGVKQKL